MNDTPQSLEPFRDFNVLDLPIGIYLTTATGEFLVCNRTARKFLQLPLEGEVDANITDFYLHPEDRTRVIGKLEENESQGKNLEGEVLHFRVGEDDIYVEDYCMSIYHPKTKKVVGFAGCLIDITHEHEARRQEKILREQIEELRLDINRILHANTTTLLMVKQTLDAVVEAFEPKPYEGMALPSADETEKMLVEHANALAKMLERFLEFAKDERQKKALSQVHWNKLKGYEGFLREFRQRIPTPESWAVTLRKAANEIGNIHKNIKPGYIPRESARELETTAWHLERLTNLIEVLHTRASVIQMDYSIHSLREAITYDVRETIPRKRRSIKKLIEQCVTRLAEYAHSLKVDIDFKDLVDVEVFVNERDMIRALSNLLHNAIKYSWHRDPEASLAIKRAWVSIHTETDEKKVYIEFENWGVAIKREEVEKEKIFELGYRGELSKDRGRLGTGIGLTDTRRVVEAHGGRVEVESRPARRYSVWEDHPEYYDQPFITKVTIILPIARKT